MSYTINAIYRDGTLKLDNALPLKDNERVKVTIESAPTAGVNKACLIGWTGDHETLRQIAESPEFAVEEAP